MNGCSNLGYNADMAKIETKKIDDLLPDSNNINRHTQRGHGLVENSIRRRGVGRGILAAGLFTSMPFFVALNAKGDSVSDFISKFWKFSPFFQMVSVQISAFISAILTRVIISFENICTPFFIFVSTHCAFSLSCISFIGGVLFAFLKVGRVSPFCGGCSFFYPIEKPFSKCWVLLQFLLSFTNFLITSYRVISARLRAMYLVACNSYFKCIFASWTSFRYSLNILALYRTINAFMRTAKKFLFSNFKCFTASLTVALDSFSSWFFIGFISTSMRAEFTHSISDAILRKIKFFLTVLANSYNHFHYRYSKKVLPSGGGVVVQATSFNLWGAWRIENPPFGLCCLNTWIIS